MAKLLLKWDLTKGNANDLSGNGWDGMFYGGIGATPNPKGVYLGGVSQFINSDFRLPVDKDYYIIFKMNPTKFLVSNTNVRYLVHHAGAGLTLNMRPYDYSTEGAASNILGMDYVNSSWVNNPFDIRGNKKSYTPLYDGTEKTVVFCHPGKLGEDIQTIINGDITCTMKYSTRVPTYNAFRVGVMGEGDKSYLGYISSVAVYEGKYEVANKYAILNEKTGDIFSYDSSSNILIIPGKIDEMTPDILRAKGTDLLSLKENVMPRLKFPFKIITIQ